MSDQNSVMVPRELLTCVISRDHGVVCQDIGGENWFDFRDRILAAPASLGVDTGLSAEEVEALEAVESWVQRQSPGNARYSEQATAIICAALRRAAQHDAPKPEVDPADRDYLDDAISYFNGLDTTAGLNLADALMRIQAALGSKE